MKESKCTNCGWFGPISHVTPKKCPQCEENTMVPVTDPIDRALETDYPLINMMDIDPEARKIAVRWGDEYFPGIAMMEKHKLASDIMNYARRKNNSEDLSIKSDRIALLEKYSMFLTKEGYMDTDWKDEEPKAIDEFLKTLK